MNPAKTIILLFVSALLFSGSSFATEYDCQSRINPDVQSLTYFDSTEPSFKMVQSGTATNGDPYSVTSVFFDAQSVCGVQVNFWANCKESAWTDLIGYHYSVGCSNNLSASLLVGNDGSGSVSCFDPQTGTDRIPLIACVGKPR